VKFYAALNHFFDIQYMSKNCQCQRTIEQIYGQIITQHFVHEIAEKYFFTLCVSS